MRNAVVWTALLLMAFMPGPARPQSVDAGPGAEADIKQTLAAFLTSFENLDWPNFRTFFVPDATMFHPAAPNEKRIDSPQEFEKAWLGVFARIRKNSGRNSAPFMSLQPQDLKIQIVSPGVAVVSFHLSEAHVLSRRTIVFRHGADGWKIVHIHASNLAIALPERQAR